jgi:hypothetical protein
MKDFLLDIVSHTLPLNISLVKITGDDNSTVVEAAADDKSVILKGTFKTANPAFKGVFGMPNIPKLNTILNIPEYNENAQIKLETQDRNGEIIPSGLEFENASGDFKNYYRFMGTEMVNEKLKSMKFKGVNWQTEFEPSVASIQRFKFQANANNGETVFIAKIENNQLKFYFGDHSTNTGSFVFHSNVSGNITKTWYWPIAQFQSILNLYGDKTVYFSDEGATQITVDSGLVVYEYILPAQSK